MSDRPVPPAGTHPAAWPVRGPQWIDPKYGEELRELRRPRPKTVKAACIITWLASGLVVYFYLLETIGFFLMPDVFVPMLMRWQGMAYVRMTASAHSWTHLLLPMLWVVWSIAAFVLAVLVWRRGRRARVLLIGSSALALVVALFAFPLSFLQLLACVATIPLLLVSRTWFTDRGTRRINNPERITITPK